MSYVNGQHDVPMTTSGGVPIISATGGLTLRWMPGYQPARLVAASIASLTTIAPTIAGVITFFESTVVGGATGNWTAIDTITLVTTADQGQIHFIEGMSTRIEPGNEVTAQVTTVTTEAWLFRANLYIEADQEAHQNNANMTESV